MLKVIKIAATDREALVTVQGADPEEVRSRAARELALTEAAKEGLSKPGLSGDQGTYPVDADGESSDALMHGREMAAAFRCDHRVVAGL